MVLREFGKTAEDPLDYRPDRIYTGRSSDEASELCANMECQVDIIPSFTF